MASRHGGTRGQGRPAHPIWAGACGGAAEPPPSSPDSSCGSPPSLCLPQPPDWGSCEGWDPRVGQEEPTLPVGLTPVSTRGSTKEVLAEAGRHTLRVREGLPQGGESQQPAKPWGWQGRCPAAQTPLGGLGGRIFPVPAATGRGQGHACPPQPGTHLPCSALPGWDQTWHLKEPCLLQFLRGPVGIKLRPGPSPHRLLGKGTPVTLAQAPTSPALSSCAPNSFSPAQVTRSCQRTQGLSPGTQARMWLRGPQLLWQPSAPRAVEEGPSVSPA